MEISMDLIKQLKEKTGAGIVDCKKTLTETNGDLEKAVTILQKKGLAKADKKAGRAANEGAVLLRISPDNKKGLVVKVNCETDFVGKTEDFKGFAAAVADLVFSKGYKYSAELPADVEELRKNIIAKLGENILVSDWKWIDNGTWVYGYIHMDKVGVVVDFKASGHVDDDDESKQFMKNVAMQITAMNPVAVAADKIPADVMTKEKESFIEEAKQTGKPAAVLEKIVESKLKKFYEDNVLLEQSFILDEEKKIKDLVAAYSKSKGVTVTIENFVRISL